MSTKSTGLNVTFAIELQGAVFNNATIVAFAYNNSINQKPSGEFILVDSNSDTLIERSGDFGSIIFSNVTDTTTDKTTILPFIVDDMMRINVSNSNSTYKITWSAGTKETMVLNTRAVKGSSIDAMVDVAKFFKYKLVERMSDAKYDKPSDSMIWRYISDDMWDSFERTINRSYLYNDYLYWAFDDVNNCVKLSSFKFEDAMEDKNLFIYSDNAKSSSDTVKTYVDKPKLTIWSYGDSSRQNNIGSNKDKLFPNVAFSGVNNGEMNQAGCQGPCFNSVLKSTGDNSQDMIMKNTGLTGKNDVFGKLEVVRNYPNNTHKMYSLAPTIRKYKLATYGKALYIQLYNTLGPEIGSKVSVVYFGADRKVRGMNVDTTYTDRYIITEKRVKYTTVTGNMRGNTVAKDSTEVSVMLKLVSDHLGTEGFDDVSKILDQIKDK